MTPSPPLTPSVLALARAWTAARDVPVTAAFITEALWAHWASCWGCFDVELVDGEAVGFDLLGGCTATRSEDGVWTAVLEAVSLGGPRQTRTRWVLETERDVLGWLLMLRLYCDVYGLA